MTLPLRPKVAISMVACDHSDYSTLIRGVAATRLRSVLANWFIITIPHGINGLR